MCQTKTLTKKRKEKKRKVNIKRVLILFIGIVIVVVAGIMVANLSKRNAKEEKAKETFGDDYCESVLHMATRDLAPHTCVICGEEFQDSSMRVDLCDKCAEELDRCNFCGKKLSEEIKEQRNEFLGNKE